LVFKKFLFQKTFKIIVENEKENCEDLEEDIYEQIDKMDKLIKLEEEKENEKFIEENKDKSNFLENESEGFFKVFNLKLI